MADATGIPDDVRAKIADRVIASCGMLVSDDGRNQFSCVFVKSGDAFVAITAGHGLAAVQDWNSLHLVAPNTIGMAVAPIHVSRGWVDTERDRSFPNLDLGFIQIEPSVANKLRVSWFDRGSATGERLRTRSIIAVLGMPSVLLSVIDGRPRWIVGTPALIVSQVSERRPDASTLSNPPNEHVDIWLEYPKDEIVDGTTRAPIRRLHPGGISGGGAFRIPRPD